jgi:glycosyltransferase involved in cell wall biosynthesis
MVVIMKKIKYSFIIPAKNEEKYIGATIKAIKQQKGDYEIIVVDACSNDKTAKIARKLGAKVYEEKGRGPAIARNRGARQAKGEIFVFVDADTRVSKNFLVRFEKEFSGYSGCVFRQTLYDAENAGDDFFLDIWNTLIRTVNALGFIMTNGTCFAYRKDVFRKVNGFNAKLLTNEDHDLARRVSKFGRFGFLNNVIVHTSKRRAKKMGMGKFFVLQIKATLMYFLNHKSVAEYWA